MPVGPGKSRVNLTLPEKLLVDLQHEAERTNRTVSEVVASTIEEAWHSDETRLTLLQRQLTQHEEKVELELAAIQQFLSKILEFLEGQYAMPSRLDPEKTEQPKVATYEEMYGPITHTPPAEPAQPSVMSPPRRRWPWGRES